MTQFPFARGRAFVCKNIGDYIQAIATRQFIDKVDEYVEQEEAYRYYPKDGKKIRLVMNGWFQWRAENWPPSDYIEPLLISMHISPLKKDKLLTPEGKAFLKKYSPAGCRDYFTKRLLESVGIPAYFSACLTLTLGKKYSVPEKSGGGEDVCIVDPYFEIPPIYGNKNGQKIFHWKNFFCGLFKTIRYAPSVIKLADKDFFRTYSSTGYPDKSKNFFRPYYKAAMFYSTYIKKFDKKLLLHAEYITHWIAVDMSGKITNDDLLKLAESLVKKYAAAKMVITSRIHAGLPCLGLNTPVLFIDNREVTSDTGKFNTPGRLEGLLEMFRVLTLENGQFTSDDEVISKFEKITENTTWKNKNDWKPYADMLEKTVTKFME